VRIVTPSFFSALAAYLKRKTNRKALASLFHHQTMCPKDKIDRLILNYFIEEGYQEAAISFAREIGVQLGPEFDMDLPLEQVHDPVRSQLHSIGSMSDNSFSQLIRQHIQYESSHSPVGLRPLASSSTGFSTIHQRREIKLHILKGNVTEAIRKINEYFPVILDTNNLLYFKLLRLNLIEMIRAHKLDHTVTSEKDRLFLNQVLTFVRENMINKVIHLTKLLHELEITMSLLCFNFDPAIKDIEQQKDLPLELRSLFNLSLRNKCYTMVNQAILRLEHEPLADGCTVMNQSLDLVEFDVQRLQRVSSDALADDDDALDEVFEFGVPANTKLNDSAPDTGGDTDDNLARLRDSQLESKLKKILKLWTITEQRLLDLNFIKQKRYVLDTEDL
jgi:hypothetical protein